MQITITTNPEGVLLLARLLRPEVERLTDLLDAQVAANEPGDDSWAQTADMLAAATDALVAAENACMEAGT